MRLIDADETIENLVPLLKEYVKNPYIQGIIIGNIANQPTAYDVEKAVEKIRISSGNGYRDVDGDYVPPMIETKKAIDIVRKGGVE